MTVPKNEERASGLERISIFGYIEIKSRWDWYESTTGRQIYMLDPGQDLGCSDSFACIWISIRNPETGENHPVNTWYDISSEDR